MRNFGVLVPIVTPCSRDGRIDYESLVGVCSDMINAGCTGIFTGGSTGRGTWFSLKDRSNACKTIRDHFDNKVTVFAGCSATGLADMLDNANTLASSGADIAVITAPGYFKYNSNEIEKIFIDFADKCPIPILIYDIPDFLGLKLDISTLVNILNHDNVIGIKDSSSDIRRFKALEKLLCTRDDVLLFQGKEHLLADSIFTGASGFVVSLLHIEPRIFVSLYNAAKAGDIERTNKLQVEIIKVFKLVEYCMKERPETSTLFHFLNNALIFRKICDNILLAHEGECPNWIREKANEALEICQNALINDIQMEKRQL